MKNDFLNTGLTSQEVIESRNKYGSNKLAEKKQKNAFQIFLKNLFDLMTILLFAAAIISLGLTIDNGVKNGFDQTSVHVGFFETFIIIFVIIVNALIGTFQTLKANKAVKSLSKLSQSQVRVIRDSKLQLIDSEELVIGDLIVFESGEKIAADGQIVEASQLRINESILTGESLAVDKNADPVKIKSEILGEQLNRVFSATSVINGTGKAIVDAIGDNSEIGKISQMVNQEKKLKSPLEIKLDKLGKIFFISGLTLFIAYFIIAILLLGVENVSSSWSTALVGGISLAVAAIPEGLITFTTIIQTLGMKNMAHKNAIIKELNIVETLGNLAIICSDKTGTLTQNKMTLVNLFTLENKSTSSLKHETENDLIKKSVLCTDASYEILKDGSENLIGDPTETSILGFAHKYKIEKDDLLNKSPRLASLPFDSDRKLMTVANKIGGQIYVITKGAPDVLLNRCSNLNSDQVNEIKGTIKSYNDKAYRTLAIAQKVISEKDLASNFNHEFVENDLQFLGLVAMIDPPREEAKIAIQETINAGIKTIMITGDHVDTAVAIAKELKIFQEGDIALSGEQLAKLSDQELKEKLIKISVYARVNPSDKIRIVKAWQELDQVVAMTGDGVNDAPALKAADVGTAMGITGTEVSKDAADMIIVDDNFATIVKAVDNGRKIYLKIKRVIQNLITTSLVELIVAFLGMIIFTLVYGDYLKGAGFAVFSAAQLLWINLLTHGFPAVALGLQESKNHVMDVRPYSKFESIFARRMGIDLIWQSLIISFLALLGYALGIEYIKSLAENDPSQYFYLVALNNVDSSLSANEIMGHLMNYYGSAVGFLVVGIAAVFNSLNLISEESLFKVKLRDSYIVLSSVLFSFIMLLIAVGVSNLAQLFHMPKDFFDNTNLVLISFFFGISIFPILEVYKLLRKKLFKKIKSEQITSFELIKKPSRKNNKMSI
ncbi:cation-translocating P-type ATPase [Mycoplasmopsis agassizii]|uniref:cation-translocating P-type ATPase n=1 Tax=Mycoplasmopsis agassizii TaxID=33922 RepID=UPI00352864E0